MITREAFEAFKTKRFSGRVQFCPDASKHSTENAAKIRTIFISMPSSCAFFYAFNNKLFAGRLAISFPGLKMPAA
jgi:hypothetical protein